MQDQDIKAITLHRGTHGLGFNIRGGKDQPHIPDDNGIFVTKIRESGAAAQDGTLQEGDKIIELNGHCLEDVNHNDAVNLFLNAGEEVSLKFWSGAEDKLVKKQHQNRTSSEDQKGLNYRQIGLVVSAVVAVSVIAIYFRKDIGDGLKNFTSKLGFK